MNIYYISLGCPKNQTDTESLIGRLGKYGHSVSTTPEASEIILINTCGFIQPAVTESIDIILEMSKYKKYGKKLVVTGCMTERYMKEVGRELPEIDFYTGVHNYNALIDYINKEAGVCTSNFSNISNDDRVLINLPYYAYLKISEGCDNHCSYCTIPNIRGGLVSRTIDDIEDETKALLSRGVKEIIVIAQDTTKYGMDIYDHPAIVSLLDRLENIDEQFYIKLLYLNPDGITDQLIDKISLSEKIIKYFDIPIQHISNKILKSMKRKSTGEDIKKVFEMIRSKIPDAFIRTTMIVGFPGETDREFDEIKTFIKEYKPDYVGFFPFYAEEGTEAYRYKDRIKKSIVENRIQILQDLQRINAINRINALKGKKILCFSENISEDDNNCTEGRTLFQAPSVDGKVYFIKGVANKGYGPYYYVVKDFEYPDIYCEEI